MLQNGWFIVLLIDFHWHMRIYAYLCVFSQDFSFHLIIYGRVFLWFFSLLLCLWCVCVCVCVCVCLYFYFLFLFWFSNFVWFCLHKCSIWEFVFMLSLSFFLYFFLSVSIVLFNITILSKVNGIFTHIFLCVRFFFVCVKMYFSRVLPKAEIVTWDTL